MESFQVNEKLYINLESHWPLDGTKIVIKVISMIFLTLGSCFSFISIFFKYKTTVCSRLSINFYTHYKFKISNNWLLYNSLTNEEQTYKLTKKKLVQDY